MLLQENKSNPSSQTTTETSNEIKILQDISKRIDKLLKKQLRRDSIIENEKNSKINVPLGYSPRQYNFNNLNSRIIKRNAPILLDDLTEITVTDVITDEFQSPKSSKTKDNTIFEVLKLANRNENISHKWNFNWILMTPDSSYKNAFKFNQQNNRRKSSYSKTKDNISNKPSLNLPLLRIDFPQDNYDITSIFDTNVASKLENIDQPRDSDYKFLISSEELIYNNRYNLSRKDLTKFEDMKSKILKNEINKSRDFFLKNLLQVDFETLQNENYQENPSTNLQTSKKSSPNLMHNKEISLSSSIPNEYLSYNDENKIISVENNIQDTSLSDTVLYHGYIVTPDYTKKVESNELRNKLQLKEILNEKKYSSIINDEFLTSSLGNDSVNNKECTLPLLIENAPLLPPDILGNIKLSNGNDVKKFLSVKSVDDPSWNDFEHLILDDNFIECHEKKNDQLKSLEMKNDNIFENEHNFKDKLTLQILENNIPCSSKNNLKNNIAASLNDMDRKISEIENISTLMETNFANSKKISLSVNQFKDKKNNQISKKQCHSLQIVDSLSSYNDNVQNFPEAELTKISSNEIVNKIYSNSQMTDSQISDQEFLDSYLKLNLSFIEFTSNDHSVLSNQKETMSSKTFTNFKEGYRKMNDNVKNQKKKIWNRNNKTAIDQEIYNKRINVAQILASKILNEIGLPNQSSADITLNIPHIATSNEMMLNQHRKKLVNVYKMGDQMKLNTNNLISYKPIRRVSFKNKVKLQRPEITRNKNEKKPVTYTDQLLALQPQFNKKRIFTTNTMSKDIVEKQIVMDLTPRSIISQDTDINSLLTDWSVPDNVKRILNENTHRDGLYIEDYSQMQSVNSNSVIDWDQISEMLLKHEK